MERDRDDGERETEMMEREGYKESWIKVDKERSLEEREVVSSGLGEREWEER